MQWIDESLEKCLPFVASFELPFMERVGDMVDMRTAVFMAMAADVTGVTSDADGLL